METKTIKNTSIDTIIGLYDLHTKLFTNVIEGISDKDANNRLGTNANHPAWLTGSLVQERFNLAKELGSELKTTFYELFKDHKGIQDNITYPSLTDFKKDWETITPVLRNALINISDEKLESRFEMPGETMTFFDLILFMAHREAYCIGQIALYRRLLGYEAMKY